MKNSPKRKPAKAKRARVLSAKALDAEIAAETAAVYQYCDRWCEHCQARARCIVFHETEQPLIGRGRTPEERDADRFQDGLIDSMAELLQLREDELAQRDDTAPDSPTAPVRTTAPEPAPAFRKASPVRRAADAYWKASRFMLAEMPAAVGICDSDREELMRFKLGKPGITRGAIAESLRVVQWYLPFIEIRLRQAATALADENDSHSGDTPRASDGFAKVALPAWVSLREHFVGEYGDEMLDLLLAGERLRRTVESTFPAARTFRRPGQD